MPQAPFDDDDDAYEAIERVVRALQTAGVREDAIAASLLARSIFLFREVGLKDDQIVTDFLKAIKIPLGRN
jgi:hypothetical protein